MPFVSGDTGSKLEVTCTDDDTGNAINLTGATVNLRWRGEDQAIVEKVMTPTNAVGGIAEYQFLADELYAPTMHFEVKVTDSSGKLLRSLQYLREDVREAL